MIIVDMFQEGDKLWVRPGRKILADGMVLELPSIVWAGYAAVIN